MEIRDIRAGTREVEAAHALLRAYEAELPAAARCFDTLTDELATFPGSHVPPAGATLVAVDGEVVGMVQLSPDRELRRLFVAPEARGGRLGRALSQAALARAAALQWPDVHLETLPGVMPRAVALYRSLGFRGLEVDGSLRMRRPAPFTVRMAGPADDAAVRHLFAAYFDAYRHELGAQDLDDELEDVARWRRMPDQVFLAAKGEQVVGVAVHHRFDGARAELKRMYVAPQARGQGVGRALADAVVLAARRAGLSAVLLDTTPGLKEARRLYRSMGFVERGPYWDSPLPSPRFFELHL